MEDGFLLTLKDDGTAEIYDDTYDIVIHCTSAEDRDRCEKILKGDKWIPADEPPKTDDYIFLSFENFTMPAIGRYLEDKDGGRYVLGDDDESCKNLNLFVNAWMPLPKPMPQN